MRPDVVAAWSDVSAPVGGLDRLVVETVVVRRGRRLSMNRRYYAQRIVGGRWRQRFVAEAGENVAPRIMLAISMAGASVLS